MLTAKRTMWGSLIAALLTLAGALVCHGAPTKAETAASPTALVLFEALLCCTAASALMAATKPGARVERAVAIVVTAVLILMLWP